MNSEKNRNKRPYISFIKSSNKSRFVFVLMFFLFLLLSSANAFEVKPYALKYGGAIQANNIDVDFSGGENEHTELIFSYNSLNVSMPGVPHFVDNVFGGAIYIFDANFVNFSGRVNISHNSIIEQTISNTYYGRVIIKGGGVYLNTVNDVSLEGEININDNLVDFTSNSYGNAYGAGFSIENVNNISFSGNISGFRNSVICKSGYDGASDSSGGGVFYLSNCIYVLLDGKVTLYENTMERGTERGHQAGIGMYFISVSKIKIAGKVDLQKNIMKKSIYNTSSLVYSGGVLAFLGCGTNREEGDIIEFAKDSYVYAFGNIIDPQSRVSGAALYFRYSGHIDFNSTMDFVENEVTYNSKDTRTRSTGGAVFIEETVEVNFNGPITFSKNFANWGGAMTIDEFKYINFNSEIIFSENTARSASALYISGGLRGEVNFNGPVYDDNGNLLSSGSLLKINKNVVSIGSSSFIYGAVVFGSDIENVNFNAGSRVVAEDNSVNAYGTAYSTGGGALTFFSDNVNFFGAIYDEAGTMIVEGSKILLIKNSSRGLAGAVSFRCDSVNFHEGSELFAIGNSAARGGALLFAQGISHFNGKMDFVENEATYGGAIYFSGGNYAFFNSDDITFSNNEADYGSDISVVRELTRYTDSEVYESEFNLVFSKSPIFIEKYGDSIYLYIYAKNMYSNTPGEYYIYVRVYGSVGSGYMYAKESKTLHSELVIQKYDSLPTIIRDANGNITDIIPTTPSVIEIEHTGALGGSIATSSTHAAWDAEGGFTCTNSSYGTCTIN